MARLVSGIKPSGDLTLGNYIGAIKQFIELQNEHELLIFVADLHAITVPQERLELRNRIKDIAALYIACGLDPEKNTIFIQSEVLPHAQLGWILECHTYLGELNRMTQFKDKAQKQSNEGLSTGLYTYPVLMASDVLLYDADAVPVGEDQKQHVELLRDIANRFNNRYGETFKVPEPIIPKQGARIMSLSEPSKKMSKSDESDKGYILLLEDLNTIKKKIRSAVTDSDATVKFDPVNKQGVSNLLTIYSTLTNKTIAEIEEMYAGKGYADFKGDLAEVVANYLEPIQTKYKEIRNSEYLDVVLDRGAETANKLGYRKLKKVEHKVGLGRKR